jgi:hypothetical protein
MDGRPQISQGGGFLPASGQRPVRDLLGVQPEPRIERSPDAPDGFEFESKCGRRLDDEVSYKLVSAVPIDYEGKKERRGIDLTKPWDDLGYCRPQVTCGAVGNFRNPGEAPVFIRAVKYGLIPVRILRILPGQERPDLKESLLS